MNVVLGKHYILCSELVNDVIGIKKSSQLKYCICNGIKTVSFYVQKQNYYRIKKIDNKRKKLSKTNHENLRNIF